MGINFSGGISAAGGYMQGRDEAVARDQHQADIDFTNQQRQFQQGQQQRQVVQQQREDATREQIAGIDQNAPEDVQLRQTAAAYRDSDPAKWLELHQKADQAMWMRSARQVQGLISSADGMNAGQVASQAAQIWNGSNMPMTISNPRYDENSGQVTVDVTDRDSGQTTTRTYKNKDEILNGLRALADPTTYAKLQQTQLEARMKAQEELVKHPVTTVPGGYVDNKTQQFHPTMVGSDVIGYGSDGQPIYGSKPASSGAGGAGAGTTAKAGKGVNSTDPVEAVNATLQEVAKLKNTELTDGQYLQAKDFANRVVTQNPKVPPAMAARVAVEVAKDPAKLKPELNADTGRVDMVYSDGMNGKVVFNRGIADAVNIDGIPLEALGVDPEKAKTLSPQEAMKVRQQALSKMTANMLSKVDPKEGDALRAAAFDPVKRRELSDSLRQQAAQVIEQKTAGATPQQAEAIRTSVERALNDRLDALNNNLNLVYNYGPKPAGQQKKPGQVGGLAAAVNYTPPANSPAGRAAAARAKVAEQVAARDAVAQAQQAQLSAQFQNDAKTMAPIDLVRKYDDLRMQLPTQDAAQLQSIERTIR